MRLRMPKLGSWWYAGLLFVSLPLFLAEGVLGWVLCIREAVAEARLR